jgi:hypothetical protein
MEHTFYKCTQNLTNITFTDAEMQLLNNCLKCNLHYKHKEWIKTLATEAYTSISQLHERNQIHMRLLAANNIKKTHK